MSLDGSIRSVAALAGYLVIALHNTEQAAIKLLEDFANSSGDDTSKIKEIKEFICKTFKCEDVTSDVVGNKLIFTLHGTEETGEGMLKFVFKLLSQFKLLLSEEDMNKVKGGILETVFAYYTEEKKLDVEIEVLNENILNKLNEVIGEKEEAVDEKT